MSRKKQKAANVIRPVQPKAADGHSVYNNPAVQALRERMQAEGKWPPKTLTPIQTTDTLDGFGRKS